MTQGSRSCTVCHLVVGTYEPAVFLLGDIVVHSSRAADPELPNQPGCRTMHAGCYASDGAGRRLETAEPSPRNH